MYRRCLCGIAAGNAVNIFLINDALLHTSASRLFIRMMGFMAQSSDCNPLCNTKRRGTGVIFHMQSTGDVDGTEDWEVVEEQAPLAKDHTPINNTSAAV